MQWRRRTNSVVGEHDLQHVQKRRAWPTQVVQAVQVFAQNNFIAPTLKTRGAVRPPWILRHIQSIPFLRDVPAQVFAMGLRPEHIESPDGGR